MAKKKSFSMDYNRTEQQVWSLAEPLAVACGCELIEVEYLKEAGAWYLRLYIDREPPVDHDCCQAVSAKAGAALDSCGLIEQSYFLEVSSPGLERPLKREQDFLRYNGRPIALSLYAPWQGAKEYHGLLRGLTAEAILIEQEDTDISVPRELVARARLAEL
jgi:ribosome maturation factor RimP